ncbi:MAG: ATP-dependent DNA helicase [Lachnospiraceae bacterium]|nr:ATP-dependent DNA helicase [Lachnospiraceae bacterium]
MSKKQKIRISVRSLVEFILRSGDLDNRKSASADREAMQKGSRLHRKIQKQMGASYRAEVPLSIEKEYEDFFLVVEGRADGIIEEPELVVIDEIKGVYMELKYLEKPILVHVAQAKCYAYIYAQQKKKQRMGIQMTYANLESEEIKQFQEEYSFEELETWFTDLIASYYKWAEFQYRWRIRRNESMENMEFPFPYRKDQRKVVLSVYQTIRRKKGLFVQAPTGVGKTMSVVYPAVRAVGQGFGEKIFYLTAKTITRTVAEEAFGILREKGLCCKVITLTAKEKMCICQEPDCNPVSCPRASGHYDRVNDAVFDLLVHSEAFDRDTIQQKAEEWNVCPFEMCLDLSMWADAVICDYNYVFDPNVHLRRFFGDGVKGEYIFLIDEAHNLVDRGRQMYSAAIFKEHVLAAKKLVKSYSKKLERCLEKVNKRMLAYKRECESYEILSSVGDLAMALMTLMGELELFLEERRKGLAETAVEQVPLKDEDGKALLEFYFEVRDFLNIYELLDENYVIYSELDEENQFRVQLYCVNPAQNLHNCMSKGVGRIYFSATLLPIQYYKKLLSAEPLDYETYAESPFEEKNKLLLVGGDVSSRYTRRGYGEYRKIAEYIAKLVSAKKGNYLAFFPSYKLMQDVFQIYRDKYERPDVDWIIQTPSMHEEEREIFLENFETENPNTLIGFCIMGGIFSEGIDLIGKKLIGAVIVGTGIPQISNEREILKDYYKENGFDYAYRFPGMNKVLQAGGRVIRSKEDRGVILLLDDRFLEPEYLQLFPMEWKWYQPCHLGNVMQCLDVFWKSDV